MPRDERIVLTVSDTDSNFESMWSLSPYYVKASTENLTSFGSQLHSASTDYPIPLGRISLLARSGVRVIDDDLHQSLLDHFDDHTPLRRPHEIDERTNVFVVLAPVELELAYRLRYVEVRLL